MKCWAILKYPSLPPEENWKKIGLLVPNFSFIIFGIAAKMSLNSLLVIPDIYSEFQAKIFRFEKVIAEYALAVVRFLGFGGVAL